MNSRHPRALLRIQGFSSDLELIKDASAENKEVNEDVERSSGSVVLVSKQLLKAVTTSEGSETCEYK